MKKLPRQINVNDNVLPDGTLSPELNHFLTEALAEMKANAVDHKQPPWIAFPDYPRISMGWRMGPGEDYWHAFHSWIADLSKPERDAFVTAYPEPADWQGFYASIRVDK